jgi:hypothetical protein
LTPHKVAAESKDPAMDLSDYTLDTLHRYGEFVLCRSRPRTGRNPHPPSVLVLMSRSEHPRPESVRMLEHEHSLRAELDPAWAVPPVELTQYEGRTAGPLEEQKREKYSGWAEGARGGETCTPPLGGRLGRILVSAASRVKRVESSHCDIFFPNTSDRK